MHMLYTIPNYIEAKVERDALAAKKPSAKSADGKRLAALIVVIDLYEKQSGISTSYSKGNK